MIRMNRTQRWFATPWRAIFLACTALAASAAWARSAETLADRLTPLLQAHDGDVAVAVKHLSSGEVRRIAEVPIGIDQAFQSRLFDVGHQRNVPAVIVVPGGGRPSGIVFISRQEFRVGPAHSHRRQTLFGAFEIHHCYAKLAKVIHTLRASRCFARRLDRRQ